MAAAPTYNSNGANISYGFLTTATTVASTVYMDALSGGYSSGTYTTINGSPNSTTWMTQEERVLHQQKCYQEPRDHAFNVDPDMEFSFLGACLDCYEHNLHRFDPAMHLFVIDEEEDDWLSRLAS